MAPRRQIGYAIRNALNDLGTSAHSFFHEEVFEGRSQDADESASQQAFTLLSLLADPEDIASLRCWCGFGSASLRSGAWKRVREHCSNTSEQPRAVLRQLGVGAIRIAYTQELVEQYSLLEQRLAELEGLHGEELVDALFPEQAEWAIPFRVAWEAVEDKEDLEPSDLLKEFHTQIIQPELPRDVQYVRVMSLHKSKGLTADMVIVAGCIAGMIPGVIPPDLSPAEQQRFMEEQRRLFFVAITRTRGVLVLSNFTRIRRDLAHRMRVPVQGGNRVQARTYASTFMRELGRSCPVAIAGDEFLSQ